MSHVETNHASPSSRTVTLITGASSGLGAGLAKRRAKLGEHLILVARREAQLAQLVQEIKNDGGHAEYIVEDVCNFDSLRQKLDACVQKIGPIDKLIANAGIGQNTPAKRFDARVFARVLEVNLISVAYCVEYLLPSMLERNHGHLVGIASLAGYRGLPGAGAYCASKAGLISFFESLRLDLHQTQIQVTTVCPGFVKTPMTDKQKFHMPFLMELEPALDSIEGAIDRGATEHAFPWTLSSFVKLGRWLPNFAYDKFMQGRR